MCLPSFLPLEIIISILSLLPARYLIKFRVTCKSWYALIKSQEFIKKHLEMSIAIDKNFILYGDIERNPEKRFTLLNQENLRYESELGVPFDLPGMLNYCMIVGSTNGLFCLSSVNRFEHTICLTNPSINKHLILPPSTIYSDESDLHTMLVSLGFGYHQSTNDFKVVRLGFTEPDWITEDNYEEPVPPPSEHDFDCSVEVFSLSTKVWKKLDLGCNNFSYKRHELISGVVVNECLHWRACKTNTDEGNNNKLVIMSFHMGNETFQDIEWPIIYHMHEREISLCRCFGEFRGKLGIFSFSQSELWYGPGKPPCHLWIMEEYGNKESWTCQAIVVSEIPIRMPLTITRNEKVIIRDRASGMIFCYDLYNNEWVYLNIQDEYHELNFINFTDSLVLLDLNDEPME